jgi:hypothetical protein
MTQLLVIDDDDQYWYQTILLPIEDYSPDIVPSCVEIADVCHKGLVAYYRNISTLKLVIIDLMIDLGEDWREQIYEESNDLLGINVYRHIRAHNKDIPIFIHSYLRPEFTKVIFEDDKNTTYIQKDKFNPAGLKYMTNQLKSLIQWK